MLLVAGDDRRGGGPGSETRARSRRHRVSMMALSLLETRPVERLALSPLARLSLAASRPT